MRKNYYDKVASRNNHFLARTILGYKNHRMSPRLLLPKKHPVPSLRPCLERKGEPPLRSRATESYLEIPATCIPSDDESERYPLISLSQEYIIEPYPT